MVDFPTNIPDIPQANVSETLFTMHNQTGHVPATNRILANIGALCAKLGTGASSPGSVPAVLKRLASGQSIWGPVTPAEIAVAAGDTNAVMASVPGTSVAMQKITNAMILPQTILGTAIAPQTVTGGLSGAAANIQPASIMAGDLRGGGAGDVNKVFMTANGTNVALSQITKAMIDPTAGPQLIQTQVLPAAQALVDFNGIPQVYSHLEVRICGATTTAMVAENVKLQVNGVSTASYYNQAGYGAGSAAGGVELLGAAYCDAGALPGATVTPPLTPWMGSITAVFNGYRSPLALFRTMTSLSYFAYTTTTSGQQIIMKGTAMSGVGAPITQLRFFCGGSFIAGSTFSLYGYP